MINMANLGKLNEENMETILSSAVLNIFMANRGTTTFTFCGKKIDIAGYQRYDDKSCPTIRFTVDDLGVLTPRKNFLEYKNHGMTIKGIAMITLETEEESNLFNHFVNTLHGRCVGFYDGLNDYANEYANSLIEL